MGGLVVWLKLGLSPSRVEEVVDELLHCRVVHLRMAESKGAEGHSCAGIKCLISTESGKTDLEREPGSSP